MSDIINKPVLLECSHVTKMFGGLASVLNVSFRLFDGEILGLIGPNGAGKTTLLNLISGMISITSGKINFMGLDITRKSIVQRCYLGIARTFQTGMIFDSMTVRENVLIALLFGKNRKIEKKEIKQNIDSLLELVELTSKANILAKALNLAEKHRLEIARAIATSPKLLLLDEVLAGLTPTEVLQGVKLIKAICKKGITIIMVEHIMKAIMDLSDRIIVLHHGEKIAEGIPEEIASNKKVQDCYLGEACEDA